MTAPRRQPFSQFISQLTRLSEVLQTKGMDARRYLCVQTTFASNNTQH
jgi:hypothetical protein